MYTFQHPVLNAGDGPNDRQPLQVRGGVTSLRVLQLPALEGNWPPSFVMQLFQDSTKTNFGGVRNNACGKLVISTGRYQSIL